MLILAPKSITGVWKDEMTKWMIGQGAMTVVEGSKQKRLKQYKKMTGEYRHWVVMGYETFRVDNRELELFQWDAIICDESTKIKSPTAKVSKAIRKFAETIPIRIALSGTPLINGWQDLWSQIEFVKKGALYGNFYHFRSIHAIMPIPNVPAIRGWRDEQTIKAKIAPYIFTVDKNEVQRHLPPVTISDIHCDLSDKERKIYDTIKEELIVVFDEERELNIPNALVMVGRLRQCTNGVATFKQATNEDKQTPCGKLEALKELLETLDPSEHIILFTCYAETAKWLMKELRTPYIITGQSDHRDELIAKWKANGGILIGTSALYQGMNLQEARYVVQYDLPWTKADEEQRIGRAWRTGQLRPVTVYNVMARNTIDEAVRKLLEKKQDLMNDVASITTDDVRNLLIN